MSCMTRCTADIRGLPVTTMRRTLVDCIAAGVERRLLLPVLDAAAEEAGVLTPEDVAQLREAEITQSRS